MNTVDGNKPMLAIINICTYKRPQLLKTCLESIFQQEVPENWNVEVLIIDNDKDSNNVQELDKFLSASKFKIHYIIEPEIGIPYARNRALHESLARAADFILFIDDDEEAQPGWLLAYHRALAEFTADIYTGPVQYIFPESYHWLANKGFSELSRGSVLRSAATNNVMLKASVIRDAETRPAFDTNMRYSGGSDTDFFTRMCNQGVRIVYVDDAYVTERVLENRLTLKWRLRRQFQSSANRVYLEKKLFGYNRTLLKSLQRAMRHTVEGLLRLVITPFQFLYGYQKFQRSYYHALRHFSKALGTISGMMNMHIDLYKGTDGF